MKRIHHEYTSMDDAIKIVVDEFGDKAMAAIEFVLSQTTMYKGELTGKWKFWNRAKEVLAARLDEDVFALSVPNQLPRCQHGKALKDFSGAKLYPSCGCTMDLSSYTIKQIEDRINSLEQLGDYRPNPDPAVESELKELREHLDSIDLSGLDDLGKPFELPSK